MVYLNNDNGWYFTDPEFSWMSLANGIVGDILYENGVPRWYKNNDNGLWYTDQGFTNIANGPTGLFYINHLEFRASHEPRWFINGQPSGLSEDGYITGVDFSSVVSIAGANFEGANINGLDFSRFTDWTGVRFDFRTGTSGTILPLELTGSWISGCYNNIPYWGGSATNLGGASFDYADLPGANFSNVTNWNGASFNGANLIGADFSNVTSVAGANFENANLTGVDFSNVTNWEGANFYGADLTGAILPNDISGSYGNVYFINGQATTLDSSGNGTWNGQTYVNGVVQGGGGGSVNLASGLQAFYKLSDTSDSSGNNRTLTNNGNVSFASGKLGNAAVFDQGSLSRDASFLANVSELTISAWYKNVVVGSTPMFSIWGGDSNDFSIVTGWGDGTEIGMGFNTDSGGGFYSFGSGTGIPDDGQYHHVVMVYSSSNSLFRMFVEGNQVFSEVITGALCTAGSLSQLVLGSQTESINSGSGSIDAVGIWNRALSDAEVAALYNSGNGLELEVTLETGLQAFYKLSDLYDSSGNNRTLTNNGNVSFASGKLGNAAVFDETNSLDIPENLLAGKTQASVSLWVKTTDNDGYLVSAGGLEGITVVNEGGVFTFNTVSGYTPIQTPQFINDGEWHHCVATFLNGDVVLYIDGQQSSTGQTDSVIADSGKTKMTIGKQPDDDWASFVGQIDAVGIWNRALSDAEVAELYNNGTGLEIQATLETGLQAFYKLSDLSDSSGNNRTLTNNGNVSFASGKLGNAAQTGDGSYLTLPSNAFDNVQGDFTVTAFIKIGDQSIDKWSTWFFCNFDDELCEMGFENRQLRCNFFGPNEYSGIEETANEWFFASVTASAQTGTLKIYRNGVLVASTTSGSREERSLNIGIIGGNSWSGGYFDGQIDAVGIWNRALSDAEVAELYNNGTGLELPAPAGPTVKNGWINNIYWINDVATTLDQNGDGTWVGKLYENGSLFSGSKYSLTFVDGVAQAEQIVTVIGNNIPVAFGLNEAEEPLVELVFASITSAGETVIEQIVPTVLPTGYTVAETVLAYSIDTTATFEGSINVDFILPSNISQAVFDRVKGFHVKNSGAIEEMTRVSSDFSTKRITVAITSFSDFLFLDTPPASGKIVKIQGNVKFYGNVKFAV